MAEDDDESEPGEEPGQESETEPVPEEIAADHHTAFVAYQAAKDRYKAATQGRGTDPAEVKRQAEERLRLAKSRSFCSVCKRKGHWHKDDVCPMKGKGPPPPSSGPAAAKASHECHTVQVIYMAVAGGG